MQKHKYPYGVPINIWGTNIEQSAIEQAKLCAQHSNIFSHMALMADAHYCNGGVPVGSVFTTKDCIVPGAVGADIGCGVVAWNSKIKKENVDTDALMDYVLKNINLKDYWKSTPNLDLTNKSLNRLIDEIENLHEKSQSGNYVPINLLESFKQLKSLGNGNHFWELQEDKNGYLWIMIHSGSRNFGAKIANHFINKAQKMCEKYHSPLPCKDLAFLPTDDDLGISYIRHMKLAEKFAQCNRFTMLMIGQEYFTNNHENVNNIHDTIDIHHNYANLEKHYGENVWVHRKGATPAISGKLGIIPGSMCTKSYIVTGKSNPESFHSCSHGSGRRFSRTEAKKRIHDGIDPDVSQQLGNVKLYGTTKALAMDELGSAYKNIDDVIQHQSDLIDIVEELKPIACIKG